MTTTRRKSPQRPSAAVPQLVKLVRKDSVKADKWESIRPTGRTALKSKGSTSHPEKTGTQPTAPPRGLSEALAVHHAGEYEFEPARREIKELINRSMSAAEAGVRLQSLLLRYPDLLAGQGGKKSAPTEGEGSMPREGSVPKRELLPLPLPRVTLLRDDEMSKIFPKGEKPGAVAKMKGSEAWQYIMIAALNNMDSHGNCVCFYGPPTTAQAKALSELLIEASRFVADDNARTPTDFKKELGAKLEAYWGEPVYTAQQITLLQVRPTLPAKGVAASVEIGRPKRTDPGSAERSGKLPAS